MSPQARLTTLPKVLCSTFQPEPEMECIDNRIAGDLDQPPMNLRISQFALAVEDRNSLHRSTAQLRQQPSQMPETRL